MIRLIIVVFSILLTCTVQAGDSPVGMQWVKRSPGGAIFEARDYKKGITCYVYRQYTARDVGAGISCLRDK